MNDAPPSDVAEISLVGTGYGKSVVVHVGDGEWIIVDSCAEKEVPHLVQSSAVSYLRKIGVDLSRQVSFVFATHWHGDHIAELSKVVGRAARRRDSPDRYSDVKNRNLETAYQYKFSNRRI